MLVDDKQARERLDVLKQQWSGSNSLGAAQAYINGLTFEVESLSAQVAEEVKNKKEFERDWLEACDQVITLRAQVAELKKDYVGMCEVVRQNEGDAERMRKEHQDEIRAIEREAREESRSAAAEASWKERQGDDYGSY